MKIFFRQTLALVMLFSGLSLKAQDINGSQTGDAQRNLEKSLPPQELLPLYKGTEYLHYAPTIQKGHPFFQNSNFQPGSVTYEGVTYHNVPLLYDLVTDQLILEHFGRFFRIQLNKDDVVDFQIAGHKFRHIFPEGNAARLTGGYYDVLHEGKIDLLARRVKTIRETPVHVEILREIFENDFYLLKVDNQYHAVKTVKAALKLMGGHSDAVRQHLKKAGHHFKREKEAALIDATKYYDQISE